MKPLFLYSILTLLMPLLFCACAKVGPDFVRPDAPVSSSWLEVGDSRISARPPEYSAWWREFNDPVLDRLVDAALRQNLNLRIAGVRVLEARAQLGVAIGGLFPQSQFVSGALTSNRISDRSTQAAFSSNLTYEQSVVGLTASWEIDFWGKFRRAVESADAGLRATIADYENALVSLTADLATSYILSRTLEKRIDIARQNVEAQLESLRIAEARFQGGTTSERDVEQAATLLNDTKASIPALEAQLRQAKDALSVLLGLPPSDLTDMLGTGNDIPVPPSQIAVGIPADLLRRRPDVRSAEYQAAEQSARIGIARAELFPAFSLGGTFGFLSTNFGGASLADMFRWGSREYAAGASVQWSIFNYGRLTNNVRVQDARLQELLINHQNTVLKAQQEVEDNLAAFLRAQERAGFLARSVDNARRSFDLALIQYQGGATDFTTVLIAQKALLNQQDSLASTLGSISQNLVGVYRALGGGWQIGEGMDLIPPEIKETMAKRTDWGNLLDRVVYMPAEPEKEQSLIRSPDW